MPRSKGHSDCSDDPDFPDDPILRKSRTREAKRFVNENPAEAEIKDEAYRLYLRIDNAQKELRLTEKLIEKKQKEIVRHKETLRNGKIRLKRVKEERAYTVRRLTMVNKERERRRFGLGDYKGKTQEERDKLFQSRTFYLDPKSKELDF